MLLPTRSVNQLITNNTLDLKENVEQPDSGVLLILLTMVFVIDLVLDFFIAQLVIDLKVELYKFYKDQLVTNFNSLKICHPKKFIDIVIITLIL